MDHSQQRLIEESIEAYQQRRLTRREALRRIAAATGSMALASGILAACSPSAAPTPGSPPQAAPPAPTAPPPPTPAPAPTPAAEARMVDFPGEGATILGYLARPAGHGPFPAVLVSPENQGLLEHFKDVARRFAGEGYVGLALDTLSRHGGTGKATEEQARTAYRRPLNQHAQDFHAAFRYLQSQPFVRPDRIGMTGFCLGGEITWLVAARTPELRAAVPFYGSHPPLEEVPNIRASVLAIYGELDRFINPGIPAIEAAMAQHAKTFEKEIYPDADHAFFNNDKPRDYNAEAARAAWARTLAWFEKYLRA